MSIIKKAPKLYSPKWVLFASRPTLIFEREFRKRWYLWLDNFSGLKISRLLVIGDKKACSMYTPAVEDRQNENQIAVDENRLFKKYFSKFKSYLNQFKVDKENDLDPILKKNQLLGPCLICTYYIERLLTKRISDKKYRSQEAKRIRALAQKNGSFRNQILQILDKNYKMLYRFYKKTFKIKDIEWCTIGELKQGRINDRVIKSRKKFFVAILSKKRTKILTGKKATDYLKKEQFRLEKVSNSGQCQGLTAYKGKVVGKVLVVNNLKDLKSQRDRVIVTFMTQPQHNPYLKNQKAFVTDEGGITCHAAITAREFKIPCVVGTKIATEIFKTGDIIEVDANKGIVRRLN